MYIRNYLNSRVDDDMALFVAERKPLTRLGTRGIECIINRIAARAKFKKSVFPHLLRHTMATLSYQCGAPLTTIQHLLGHESPATTQIYAQESMENIQNEYKKHFIQ